MANDAQGLQVNTTAEAVADFDAAVLQMNSWRGDPLERLRCAVQLDPDFGLGYSAQAALLSLSGVPGTHVTVRQALLNASATLAGANRREHAHYAAASAWAGGEIIAATDIWEAILLEWPTDALALKFAHDSYFYLGHSHSLRDSIARVLPRWDSSSPNYGFVLGQYAFGLEESGNLSEAEAFARRALAHNPADAWAAHALAHVFETQSRQQEGIDFLRSTRDVWACADALAVHLGWHMALYRIEAGDLQPVLEDYDRFVAPRLPLDSLLDLVDAASLLWRIELAGGVVGERWQPLAQQWSTHVGEHVLVFNDLHMAMALARGASQSALLTLRASLDAYVTSQNSDNAQITREVGMRLIDSVGAFAMAEYGRCIDCLLPVRYKFNRIGGSHAQRDVLTQTLIVAARRAGRGGLLRALLAERMALRPTLAVRTAYAQAICP